jgi:electron transfer flavoprotein alpha subunit
LLSENDDLSRSYDTAFKNLNESYDLISSKDHAISTLESHLQIKNHELDIRLENISRLIQKNEQLTTQLRVLKLRTEKFKADSQAQHQKELQERTSEVEVLKEMIKAVQVSLKAKESEIKRMKAAKTVITQ